ncbi:hypothetical protein VHEMI00615 [[Torrubiella] hemipterigena]|uniref:CoA-transferase family III n=1 Tax=[Torrubiella] hemipterigena TaxID=1531966 RepID=A0A0A1SJQ1_9HYPO|nr:hypothetical protein VHEMI00615 [[Torrubiella] hemipterigena]
MGARVIKIERPGVGDFARAYDTRVNGMASHFVWVNRSKESLALDLKNPSHLKALKKILSTADVMIQNLAPGATSRLGLGHDDLIKLNPSIISCDISGYGSSGPYQKKKAYDLLVQSEVGLLSVNGTEEEPAKVGVSIADIAAGMYAYTNILTALFERPKTGKGKHIDISMLESIAEWVGFPMYYAYGGQSGPARAGAAHATIYPYGPFEAGGNESVMLGIQNEREWLILCRDVLENETLATDDRFSTTSLRSKNRVELSSIICDKFKQFSAAQVIEKLDKARIANAKVNDMDGLWNHDQLQARDRWVQVDTEAGPIPALLPPGTKDSKHARMDQVPTVGQHTQDILHEFDITLED